MHIQSQLKDRAAMAADASHPNEAGLVRRNAIGPAFVDRYRSEARACAGLLKSIGDSIFHPVVEITPAESVKRLGTGWHGWFSESVHIPIGSRIEFRFEGPTHLLVAYHAGLRKNGETSIDNRHSSSLRSFVRKLTFVPAGCVYRESHETSVSTRVTFLYLDPSALQKLDDGEGGFPPRLYFEDSLVWETASKLKNTIESSRPKCRVYLEALSSVLAHELSRVDQELVREPAVKRGGLAGWQRRVVADYVEAHLGEQVCLLKLAELARLSLHHFCRAFKQSFGMPAHQYQVRRRMDAAKLLLADRTMSVTEIGLSLGYAKPVRSVMPFARQRAGHRRSIGGSSNELRAAQLCCLRASNIFQRM